MKKPRIGITGGLAHCDSKCLVLENKKRAYSADDYVQSVAKAGGIPYILPIVHDYSIIKDQVSCFDGLIFTGGEDISPTIYGEEPHVKLDDVLPERDIYETEVLKIAEKNKIPVLGICRGNQMLNVYKGGTLYQDISLQKDTWIKHAQHLIPEDAVMHKVEIEKDTWLYSLFNSELTVNSFHHQAIKKLGKNLKVTSYSKDGVIEGVEKIGDHFYVGVQWHPEMMLDCKDMKKLFREFIKVCASFK